MWMYVTAPIIISAFSLFEKKNYLEEMKSQSAKLAIKYRLKMNNLAYHYKNNKTDMCCPLCKDRDGMNHLTTCESYRHINSGLKISDIYSDETDSISRATEEIREGMEHRETRLLTKQ